MTKSINKAYAISSIVDEILKDIDNNIHDLVQGRLEDLGLEEASIIAHSMLLPVNKQDQIDQLEEALDSEFTDDEIDDIAEAIGVQEDYIYECDNCGQDLAQSEDCNGEGCQDKEEEEED